MDGVVLRGAKMHQTGSLNAHFLIAMPGGRMTDVDADYAIACALPVTAPGLTYIMGRQSCDLRSMEQTVTDIDHGNAQFGGQARSPQQPLSGLGRHSLRPSQPGCCSLPVDYCGHGLAHDPAMSAAVVAVATAVSTASAAVVTVSVLGSLSALTVLSCLQESTIIFDNVFIPNEMIFMDGEAEFCSELVERFTAYHRRSYICKAGLGDVLLGAAATISDYNGTAKASHIKDKLVEMAYLNENIAGALRKPMVVPTFADRQCYVCARTDSGANSAGTALAASFKSTQMPAGNYMPDVLMANVCKHNVTPLRPCHTQLACVCLHEWRSTARHTVCVCGLCVLCVRCVCHVVYVLCYTTCVLLYMCSVL